MNYNNVGQLRKFRKMSVIELAEKAGITRQQVYAIEAGKHSPTIITLEKLAKALRVHPSVFFDIEPIKK